MEVSDHYESDVLFFFEERPVELAVYQALFRRLESSRVSMAVEPYPRRWTHHVLVAGEEQLDAELMGWLREAYEFAVGKR